MTKKLYSSILILLIAAFIAMPVVRAEDVEEKREEILQKREEVRERIVTKAAEAKQKARKQIPARLDGVKITAKDGNTITVEHEGKQVVVNFDDKTVMRRRFWGKSDISEMQIGDLVNVIGKWTDDTQTAVDAMMIRDTSIVKRKGVFFGSVISVSGNSLTMKTASKGNLTVTVDQATKITDRRGKPVTVSEIVSGHRIRVKGLFDNKTNTVAEVTDVKDFSLPPETIPTAKPSI